MAVYDNFGPLGTTEDDRNAYYYSLNIFLEMAVELKFLLNDEGMTVEKLILKMAAMFDRWPLDRNEKALYIRAVVLQHTRYNTMPRLVKEVERALRLAAKGKKFTYAAGIPPKE